MHTGHARLCTTWMQLCMLQEDGIAPRHARSFQDCSLSWDDLEELLQRCEQEHGCKPEDLETVRPCTDSVLLC